MLESLISFSIATILLAFSPGPDNLYVITQSLVNGTKSGIATTLGLVSGCIIHTTLLAFGVSAIISASYGLFYILKVIGAFYLLYLAYQVFKSETTLKLDASITKKTPFKLFKQGVLMNLMNPKILIFFLAFFPGFLLVHMSIRIHGLHLHLVCPLQIKIHKTLLFRKIQHIRFLYLQVVVHQPLMLQFRII